MRFLTPLGYDIDIRINVARPRTAGKVAVRDVRPRARRHGKRAA
jgi:hypothetical protein